MLCYRLMGNNDGIPRFEVYTEVIQDAVIEMMEEGNISFASGCSLTVSNDVLHQFYNDLDYFKKKLVLRPSEISNNPGVIRRMGVLALNTAIEVDIFGNVNSTHVNGTRMMNGIGGSGDFLRNAGLSIMHTPSTRPSKNDPTGISCVVPFATHVDHTEHDLDILVTEQGLADLRGLCPRERAREIISKCAHPDYRPILTEYYERAEKECFARGVGHEPHMLFKVFKMQGKPGSQRHHEIASWE